jgi:hypothetical protein
LISSIFHFKMNVFLPFPNMTSAIAVVLCPPVHICPMIFLEKKFLKVELLELGAGGSRL